MRTCSVCGNQMEDNDNCCANCGTPANTISSANKAGITERNIVLCILFSFITCGIYDLYWIYKLNEEINQLSGHKDDTSGGLVILFGFLTCGIYMIYWYYKMGQKVDQIKGDYQGNSHIVYLLLAIFELSIVDVCLMQDTINKAIAA